MYIKESRESADREIDTQAWHIEKRTPLIYIRLLSYKIY